VATKIKSFGKWTKGFFFAKNTKKSSHFEEKIIRSNLF